MNRRVVILGGVGLAGAAAVGAFFWPSPHPQHGAMVAADAGKSAKPALVFVGHEL